MSQLLNNTTGLQDILEALQNKGFNGGEGTTVDTCTVTFNSFHDIPFIAYTAFEEGQFKTVIAGKSLSGDQFSGSSYVAKNVVCGSMMTIGEQGSVYLIFSYYSGGVAQAGPYRWYADGVKALQAPLEAGANATVTFEED